MQTFTFEPAITINGGTAITSIDITPANYGTLRAAYLARYEGKTEAIDANFRFQSKLLALTSSPALSESEVYQLPGKVVSEAADYAAGF